MGTAVQRAQCLEVGVTCFEEGFTAGSSEVVHVRLRHGIFILFLFLFFCSCKLTRLMFKRIFHGFVTHSSTGFEVEVDEL